MVYTIQRFRVVPNPLDTPISIGGYEEGGNAANLPNPSYGYNPNYPYGPINFPIPSTSPHPGTIDDIPSNTCPSGQAPNSQGVCTPINQLPACQTGYARDTSTGQCVPIPIGSGAGNITQVQVPTSTTAGGANVIKTWFTNTSGQTLSYSIRVVIPSLGIDMTSPSISLSNNQSGSIEVTITVPANAAAGSHSGFVELKAISAAGLLYLQDSEPFTFVVTSTGTNPPPPGTGTCPSGDISFTIRKVGTRKYEIRWSSSGYKSGETVGLWYSNNATGVRFASQSDSVSGSTDGDVVSVPTGISCVKVQLKGLSSNKINTGYFTPI